MTALSVDSAPGGPMHHELLSAIAGAFALLQHTSLHTCPHTWAHRRYSFFEYRQDLKLPLVFRAQEGSEATDPILCGDNAISVRQIRPGAAYFVVLEVLLVYALTRAVKRGGCCWRFARARAPEDGWLVQSMPWTGHVHDILVCSYIFRQIKLECRHPSGSGT